MRRHRDLGLRELRLVPRGPVAIRRHDLVHERFVIPCEGRVETRARRAIDDFEFHVARYFFARQPSLLTELGGRAVYLRSSDERLGHGRTMTWPISTRDGAADQSRLRSVSISTTFRFSIVRARHPVARHALALEHSDRRLALTDGTRGTVRDGHAVRA